MDYKARVLDMVLYQSTLERYVEKLLQWNTKINLISRRSSEQLIYYHMLDAIALAKFIPNNASVLDVGSGNGILGIVLSILGFTDCHLVEISTKKSAFLLEAASTLKLNIKISNIDIKKFFDKPEYIISKATFPSLKLVETCKHLLTSKTNIFIVKSYTQYNRECHPSNALPTPINIESYPNPYKEGSIILKVSNNTYLND